MELQSSKHLIKINGTEYELRLPTVGEVRKFEKNKDAAGVDEVIEVIHKCGLPLDVIDGLEVAHLEKISNYLFQVEKKNQATLS